MEEPLLLRTYIAARSDNKSKIASEFMRAFVKKLSHFNTVKQLPLPVSAQAASGSPYDKPGSSGTISTLIGPE